MPPPPYGGAARGTGHGRVPHHTGRLRFTALVTAVASRPTTVAARAASARVGLAVLGAWLAVLPGASVTLALRLDTGAGAPYPLAIAGGWGLLIAALALFGGLGDRSVHTLGSRRPLLLGGIAGVLTASALLAAAVTPASVIGAWLLLQIPAAALLAAALGLAHDVVPEHRRGRASGLAGAAPIAALLVGTIVVRLTPSPSWAFLASGVLGAALAVPLLLARRPSIPRDLVTPPPDARPWDVNALVAPIPAAVAIPAIAVAGWALFLASDVLLSFATAATNSFIVPFVATVSDAGDVATTATSVVFTSALAGLAGALTAGRLSRGPARSLRTFALGCLIAGVALVVVLADPVGVGLWAGAALFGAAFGLANGAELAVVLGLRDGRRIGRDLGVLAALTSVPYIPVALAVVGSGAWLASGDALRALFAFGALACAVAAVLAWVARRAPRRERQGLGG